MPDEDNGSGRSIAGNQRDRAYGSFTQHLLSRDLRAGQFISQREIVELTGLTLGAVRELIPRLETEGLIRTVPKRGMQIAHVDLNMIRDAFQFRAFLEIGAIKDFTGTAAASTILALRNSHATVIARCQAAQAADGITPDHVHEAQAVDWSLHKIIINALGNQIVRQAYHANAIKIRLIKQEQTSLSSNLVVPTMQEHMKVIAAIETRDCEKAAAAIADHIENARIRALEQR